MYAGAAKVSGVGAHWARVSDGAQIEFVLDELKGVLRVGEGARASCGNTQPGVCTPPLYRNLLLFIENRV